MEQNNNAIEFGQFLNNNCTLIPSLTKDEWYYHNSTERVRKTTSQLYLEFLKEKITKANNELDELHKNFK